MPRHADLDPVLPVVTTLADAVAAGLTVDQVRQRLRSGRWERIARGSYLPSHRQQSADLDEYARVRLAHVYRAIAAAERNRGAIIGYSSAAFVHALPVLGPVPANVTLVVPPGHWTGQRSGITFRRLRLLPDHVEWQRVGVTTATRTWVDVACRGTLADALAAGDAGLRRGILDAQGISDMLASVPSIPGRRRAERAAHLLDAVRETPLESASVAYFVENRLPLPRPQVVILDEDGFVGRVDFLWDMRERGLRVVGESDGIVKYGDRGEAYREKVREDRLRNAGYLVVRWGLRDLQSPALAARLRRILGE